MQGYHQQPEPRNELGNGMVYSMQTQEPGLSSSTINLVTESTEEPYTCLYVMSVLASIFCTFCPCGLIGLMHIIAARGDYSRGSHNLSRKKRGQALCWTSWACGLGFGWVLIVVILSALVLGGTLTIAGMGYHTQKSYSFNNFG